MPDTADLLITGGTLVDGTGADGFAADVAVIEGRIQVIRDAASRPGQAGTIIDASGKVVCPGFIDLHSHSGLWILAEPRHEPKVRQGVTTELVGVDGNAYAPFHAREDLEAFVQLNGGLDGRPDEVVPEGVPRGGTRGGVPTTRLPRFLARGRVTSVAPTGLNLPSRCQARP